MDTELDIDTVASVAGIYADYCGLQSLEISQDLDVDIQEAMEVNQLLPVFLLCAQQYFVEAGLAAGETGYQHFPFTFEPDTGAVSGLSVQQSPKDRESTAPQSLALLFLGSVISNLAQAARMEQNLSQEEMILKARLDPILKVIENAQQQPTLRYSVPALQSL